MESGKIPVSVAVDIAEAEDTEVQDVLHQAYENDLLRGGRLMAAKRLVKHDNDTAKGDLAGPRAQRTLSVESLIRTYQNDVEKKQVCCARRTRRATS